MNVAIVYPAALAIGRDRGDGSLWYRTNRPRAENDRNTWKAHWAGMQLALSSGIPIIGILKDAYSNRCSLQHTFDCSDARYEADGNAFWLKLTPRNGVGTDVDSISIDELTVRSTSPLAFDPQEQAYAVIVENDISQWSDETGALFHYPRRYKSLLLEGTRVVYYKGTLRDEQFAKVRKSREPHYFGIGRIGKSYPDLASEKGDLFALIEGFAEFKDALPIKSGGQPFEEIPASRTANYWRDGVRKISKTVYENILSGQELLVVVDTEPNGLSTAVDDDLTSGVEGDQTKRYVTTYERKGRLRRQAIAIHGATCKACDMSFLERYGSHAAGFIHVHHVVPISEFDGPTVVDPATDLIPVCANCHAVIHRNRTSTLTVEGVKALLEAAKSPTSKVTP